MISQRHSTFNLMEAQMQQMQAALAQEQSENAELKDMLERKGAANGDGGFINAIRRGQMKDIAPKKYASIQNSGNFQLWSRAMRDYRYWHDPGCKHLMATLKAV